MLFRNRMHAGQVLAEMLQEYGNREDVVVLALPRGGLPVAFEIASALHAPLDVFLVRKLGVPGQEELAMGAIATGGIRVLNYDVIRHLGVPENVIDSATKAEQRELDRREHAYRGSREPPEVRGRSVILIDDGLATGSTMRAAVTALRQQTPARIVVAVPVAAVSTCQEFQDEVDQIICAATPEPFYGVGQWYEDFSQTTDEEVRDLLDRAAQEYERYRALKRAS
jgi:putative phosphoribosyl transferase